ncbi:hypothetical protein NL676_023550 [Syzygium grande]|nr:hypothetical protein NL676_023550 [Syzygium grande]
MAPPLNQPLAPQAAPFAQPTVSLVSTLPWCHSRLRRHYPRYCRFLSSSALPLPAVTPTPPPVVSMRSVSRR